LIDWKNSASGPHIDWLIQLAAYAILWEENHSDDPIDGGFHLCRFSKDNADFHHHYWSELDLGKKQFLLLVEAYKNDKELRKRL
jgi:hypothetical protein